jgi:hypothetical protein
MAFILVLAEAEANRFYYSAWITDDLECFPSREFGPHFQSLLLFINKIKFNSCCDYLAKNKRELFKKIFCESSEKSLLSPFYGIG